MSSRTIRFAALWVVPCAALAFGTASAATKKPADVKEVCQKDVMKKIKAKHGGAHDIQLTISREWQQSSTESGVGGTGSLKAANNSGREFEWTCVYDTTKNKVVSVDFDKPKRDKEKK
ncbi:MAG TPA: hypothetical protein VMR86_04920 [Myxococcota bacterium]|nr:hypothetical protein [Myxococcota bacterium]